MKFNKGERSQVLNKRVCHHYLFWMHLVLLFECEHELDSWFGLIIFSSNFHVTFPLWLPWQSQLFGKTHDLSVYPWWYQRPGRREHIGDLEHGGWWLMILLVIKIVLWGKFYYYSHCTDEETKAWKRCVSFLKVTLVLRPWVFGHYTIPPSEKRSKSPRTTKARGGMFQD